MADQTLHISLPYGSEKIGFHLPVENFGELLEPQREPLPWLEGPVCRIERHSVSGVTDIVRI